MERVTVAWAADAMKADIVGDVSSAIDRVCIDSRDAGSGALFFALKGERTDGHKYAAGAMDQGAVAVVAQRNYEANSPASRTQLVVKDPLTALGDLAAAYRMRFRIPVIGITGSVGKTSTREMIAAVLRTRYTVLANEKNYNNEIGVPLTLFELNGTHEIAVIEMGMRARGEIRRLAEIAQPTIGVLTGIGYSHIEILGSREEIALAKAEMFEAMHDGSDIILPADIPYPDVVFSRLPKGSRIVTVGSVDSSVWTETLASESQNAKPSFRIHVRDTGETADVTLNTVGSHHEMNAQLAVACGMVMGISLDAVATALEQWTGASARMTVRRGPDNQAVLDDCYNASPESMRAALVTLASYGSASRVAILGDMRELGDLALELHRQLGQAILDTDLRVLVTVGDLASAIADSASDITQAGSKMPIVIKYATTEECCKHIQTIVLPGDTVLVKGSRALEMERIVMTLTGEETNPHHV